MKLAEQIEALEITMSIAGRRSTIHPVLLWGDGEGATLIDTGVPGQLDAIREQVERLGLELKDVRRIILTHQDIDHIGSAAALVKATGAEVFAHADDIPYIEGVKPLIKMTPDRIETMIGQLPPRERETVRKVLSNPPAVNVDKKLADGEELAVHGGLLAVHTPGHTPGHLSIFLRRSGILVSGDALRVEEGRLVGPGPSATLDMKLAVASLSKLVPLPVNRVICYHGGLSPEGAASRIRELAEGKP